MDMSPSASVAILISVSPWTIGAGAEVVEAASLHGSQSLSALKTILQAASRPVITFLRIPTAASALAHLL